MYIFQIVYLTKMMRAMMSLYISCVSARLSLPAGCDICESPGPLLLAYNPHSYLICRDVDDHTSWIPRSPMPHNAKLLHMAHIKGLNVTYAFATILNFPYSFFGSYGHMEVLNNLGSISCFKLEALIILQNAVKNVKTSPGCFISLPYMLHRYNKSQLDKRAKIK